MQITAPRHCRFIIFKVMLTTDNIHGVGGGGKAWRNLTPDHIPCLLQTDLELFMLMQNPTALRVQGARDL